jgi:hypothetical protein
MCVARKYSEVVTGHLYEQTWLAPESNMPASLEGISKSSQVELLKVGMMAVGPFTVGWFPAVAILYVRIRWFVKLSDIDVQFLLLWVSSLVIRMVLSRQSIFLDLSWALQRTTTICVCLIGLGPD